MLLPEMAARQRRTAAGYQSVNERHCDSLASGMLVGAFLMRLLLIAFLVSLAALLAAAAGAARHVWLHRSKSAKRPSVVIEPAEETDLELKS